MSESKEKSAAFVALESLEHAALYSASVGYVTELGAAVRRGLDDTDKLDDLAEALLMFYTVGHWDPDVQARWKELTGHEESTTRALCDFARRLLANRREVVRG